MQKTMIFLFILPVLLIANTSFTEEIGCIKGECENGTGIMLFHNGSKFKGEFFYADGSRHIGAFRNGYRNGQGLYTAPEGTQYSGTFLNDKFLGQNSSIN